MRGEESSSEEFLNLLRRVGLPILVVLAGLGVAMLLKEILSGKRYPVYLPWGEVTPSGVEDEDMMKLREMLQEAERLKRELAGRAGRTD